MSDVPAPARHEKFLRLAGDLLQGQTEIIEEKDVAIDMAKKVVVGKILGLVVNAGQILCAVRIPAHFWHVTNT